jgi:RNA polymerase sigma-70 factor (ECF subfamily)
VLHQEGELTDRALLARCAGGDRTACGAFVERHRDAVWRYALALTGDAVTAEDVLQDTFLAALRGASAFAGDDGARGWIVAIARNAAHRRHRRRAGEPARFDSLDALGEAAGWGADDAEAVMERAEERAVLARALASLPTDDREVLVLRDLEGLDGPHVAELLGLPLPTMKTRLHRARLRFAAALRHGGLDAHGA